MPKIKRRLFRARRHPGGTIDCVANHGENPAAMEAASAIHLRDCPLPDPAILEEYLMLRRVCRPKGLVMQSAIKLLNPHPQEPVFPEGIPVPLDAPTQLESRGGRSVAGFLNSASQRLRDFGRGIRNLILPECATGLPAADHEYPTGGCTLLAFDRQRIISYCLFDRAACNALRLGIGPHGIDRSSAHPLPFRSTRAVPHLSLAWSAEHYRGSGLATSAIDEVRRAFSFEDTLAFALPFTSAGTALTTRASASGTFIGVYPETLSVAVGLHDERVLRDCHARVEVEPADWDEGLEMDAAGIFAHPQVLSFPT
jgi:hypothetical protein